MVQPPFSLLAKRIAVIERFDLLEVFLAVRSACCDDFPSLPETFEFRESTRAGDGADRLA